MGEPRYRETGGATVCEDCGAVVAIREAHTRFHSIQGGHAWALAVLKTAHIAAHVHDRYDVPERIGSRKFDSWSADALAGVTGARAMAEPVTVASGNLTELRAWLRGLNASDMTMTVSELAARIGEAFPPSPGDHG